ncbi:hypothetical protein AOC36_00280 [Erysipelothrix larvae]|uniref:ABC3 transporter permease protein domain-containing protein n=1 Tax=Erysipelothrix larvae TaxID=1514105 RepID=A0A0X8GXZ1_9FIRM|nr:FtsX-like permease family protein [Erysipelothrix larvae]AMC92483.1 hypothetical protein AOC36_00280 [Erysipelothrix larvae]
MILTKIKLLKFIIISNVRQLSSTIFFYAITSVLIFFILILNDSLNHHISDMFPKEFFISASIDAGTHVLDITHKVFTPNYITQFNQVSGYTIQVDMQDPEITVQIGSTQLQTAFSISCCDASLSMSEYFAETHDLNIGDPLLIQGQYYRISSIHSDFDDPSPLILPMDSDIHFKTQATSFKIVDSNLDEVELDLALKQSVDNPHIQFDILTFDIEDALNSLVNILFSMLFAVGILVFIVASFNIKSMTILSITKRQREIVLYFLYGLPKKDLFLIFQIESFCVHMFSLLISYSASVSIIYLASLLFSFSFSGAIIKSIFVSIIQIFFVQRITQKILVGCINESISKI